MTEQAKDRKAFLSRWSERKLAARADPARSIDEPQAETAPQAEAAGQAEREANRAAAEAIDLETLTDKSDYAPFFRPGVPSALRSAALQRLWRSNPVFAVLDGLNDHDLDYRWPQPGTEVVRTGWKVGRGLLQGLDGIASKNAAAEASGQDATPRPAPGASAEAEPAPVERAVSTEALAPGNAAAMAHDDEAARERATPPRTSLASRLGVAAFAERKDER